MFVDAGDKDDFFAAEQGEDGRRVRGRVAEVVVLPK